MPATDLRMGYKAKMRQILLIKKKKSEYLTVNSLHGGQATP